jgi:hypothetical protein
MQPRMSTHHQAKSNGRGHSGAIANNAFARARLGGARWRRGTSALPHKRMMIDARVRRGAVLSYVPSIWVREQDRWSVPL